MAWISSKLKTKALYWAPPKRDGLGNYIWPFPDEVLCKWRNGGREVKYNVDGSTLVSTAQVLVLNSYLLVGGYLMLGGLYTLQNLLQPPLEDSYDIKDGLVVSQEYARQIVDIDEVPSVITKDVLYKLWLV